MAVRIVFRGLILFQFPDAGRNAGKFVAFLINHPEFTGGIADAERPQKGHGRHEHNHSAEIQILTGEGPGHDPLPRRLAAGTNVDIVVAGEKRVTRAPSFDRHVPDLGNIIANGTDAVKKAVRGAPNTRLIQNVITVDRGVVRAKTVVAWDEEGYPLRGGRNGRGARPGGPVVVKFMGSSVSGHAATDVVVEIDDAQTVELQSEQEPQLRGQRRGTDRPNHRVPPETVEILIANYEFRREGPVAWGLDYQWLFETVGYGTADLAGEEFDDWSVFARNFDQDSFESERELLLDGANRTVGRPFPYIQSENAVSALEPLADLYNPPVCMNGSTGIIVPFPP